MKKDNDFQEGAHRWFSEESIGRLGEVLGESVSGEPSLFSVMEERVAAGLPPLARDDLKNRNILRRAMGWSEGRRKTPPAE